MKKNIITLLTLIIATVGVAQEEQDTTRFKIGNKEIIIVGNDTLVYDTDKPEEEDDWSGDFSHWSGVDIGINMPVNGNFENSFESEHLQFDPSQSFRYSINLFEKRIPIYKSYVGIVTGLGFTNSRYGFKNNRLRLMADADSTYGVQDTTLFNGFSKNQLRVNTLNVPILLQFNTSKNDDKNVHFAAGVIGGVRIGSNIKYKYDLAGGGETKNKEKGRYNLNAFQLLGTVRLGYNDVGLFANYNILPLFESDKSEEAFPLSFGVSFNF